MWSAATELARRDGVNPTAAALHLDGGKLKRRMGAANSVSGKAMPPTFVELLAPAVDQLECTIELEGRKGKLRIQWKGATAADLAGLSRALWEWRLIQIAPQMRILVAIEAIDGRKGIDSLAQLCREKLDADPFSGCLFIFRTRSGTSIRILEYDGQGFWLATKRLSQGRFMWWPTRQRTGADAASAPGAVAAGGGQPGDRSRAGVAESELK